MTEGQQQRSVVRPTDLRRRSRFVQALAFSHSTSVSPTWRRMMTISASFLMWALLTGLAPLWIPVAFVVGVFRRRSFVVLRLLVFFWIYLATGLVGLAGAAGIYLITRGNLERREDLFFRLECWWGSSLFRSISWCLSLSTTVEGEDQILPGPVLVFIRHASIIDTAVPVAHISNTTGLRLRYVFKRELLVDPCIDVAGHVRGLAENLGDQGVLLYPEGTRFTERKKEIALGRLAKTHPDLVPMAQSFKHCLPPKAGGALTLLDAAPHADVLIVAHRGLEGLAEVSDLLSGAVVGKEVEVRIWRINAADIPKGEDRRRWLFDWWKRVDDFVGGEV
jgi:1-acyl-sn-glycerol-3-phosphate acyltransferase